MTTTRSILVLLCTLSHAAAIACADSLSAVCHTVAGETLSGRVESFDLAGRITLYDEELDETVGASMADLVRVEFRQPSAPLPSDASVQLVGGDRLCGTLVDGSADAMVIKNAAFDRVAAPLEQVHSYHSRLASDPKWRSRVRALGSDHQDLLDIVLLVNGDQIAGLIAQIAPDRVDIEVGGEMQQIPLDRVVALRLAGGMADKASGLRANLAYADGSSLTIGDLRYDDESGMRAVYNDHPLAIEPGRLVRIGIQGGRWTPLSSLKPAYEHVPMLSTQWPYRVDRNVFGDPLRVAGREYQAGIGVHSRSTLVYELNGEYSEFVTRFGLDDSSGPFADVDVIIRVDGREAFQKRVAAPPELHDAVRIPVKDARRLELLVDFGANGALQDRFNWIEPGLVR